MGGKGASPPPPPNYQAIANEQGVLDKQALAQQVWSNRPTQITPWGQMNWAAGSRTDPSTGQPVTSWTQTQSLDPGLLEALYGQFDIGMGRTDVATGMMGRLGEAYDQPLDYDQFRDVPDVETSPELRQRAEDAAYERSTSRLDPEYDAMANELEIKLRNQGLRAGDQAYESEMDRFNRSRTDAYAAARGDATTAGRAEAAQEFGQMQSQQAQSAALRQQEVAEALQQRGMPLDEINLLLAGQGVQPPSQPGYTSAGQANTPDLMGAAQANYQAAGDIWSAEQAQRQGMMQGMLGLGGAAMGMFSDRRLKRGIRRIGTWRGYPFYAFTFVWGQPALGVMSDEVNQDAVSTHESGFDVVDYSRVR